MTRAGIDLLMTRDADRPGQAARRQPLAERRTEPVSCIGQHAAEADTGSAQAVNLGKRDLRLRSSDAMLDWNAGPLQSQRIARPALRQEQAQRQHDRHLAAGQRQRHQRLAIGVLAQDRSILRRDADRVLALLRQRRVVDHQHRIIATNEAVGLGEQLGFERRRIPDPAATKWCSWS